MGDNFEDLLGGDFDDLLGPAIKLPKSGRPAGSKTFRQPKEKDLVFDDADASDVLTGVTVPWLVTAFKMSRTAVQDKLQTAKPIRVSARGVKFYDLPTAAQYLVVPKISPAEFLKAIKKSQLPDEMKETFWNAKLKEQKFRRNAGELWTTESIMNVLGEMLKTIKNVSILWADTVEESVGLTEEQRLLVIALRDDLLKEIMQGLKEQTKLNVTRSQVSELEHSEDET